ncbi:MAG TPA: glycosyl transferase, partial [Richelia sp.]|nr:glycosyl transferase [Richelia sp.]
MPANSWPENDSYNELDPLNSLLSDISIAEDLQAEVEMNDLSLPSRFQSRRCKAALVLTLVWSGTVALNLISWGSLFVLGLTTILSLHALVTVFTKPRENTSQIQGGFPQVSLMVAAKNEEAVISNITYNLCNLDYPSGKYEVWIVDDNSSDRTPQLLATLAEQYANLKVFRRSPDAGGGKSGALNQILPLTKGEILAVFDADAQVRSDILQQVIPIFGREKVGAVQVRKAIANVNTNFWTRGQMAEM